MSQVSVGVAWQTVMYESVVVAISPTVAVRATTSLVEVTVVVGTAPLAEGAAFDATQTPPIAPFSL